MICSRCRAPAVDGHVCHDRLRHPAVDDLFAALRACEQLDPSAKGLPDRLDDREPWDLSDLSPPELEAFTTAFEVAFIWVNLPANEQRVVNGILEHAGVPTLAA